MRLTDLYGPLRRRMPVFAPADGAADPAPAPADPTDAPPAAPDPAAAPVATGKWWEASDYSDEERQWIAARGLADDDPTKIIPKLVKGHRNAEQRIGKGLDQIIEKPGKDTPVQKWLRDNAAALGLPDKEDAYAAAPPEDWPKEMTWDADFEAQARKIAFENGVPPEAHKAYVKAFADKMKALDQSSAAALQQANADMMADLNRDFGQQTPAVIQNARRAAEWMATQAGLGADEMHRISAVLSEKTGDAGVIRMLHAVGKALGEDAAVAIGRGGPLTMTPAEARAELQALQSKGGDYYEATAKRDLAALDRLKPRIAQLSKIAAG